MVGIQNPFKLGNDMKNVDSPATRKVRPVKTGEKSRVHAFRIKSSWWCELRPN